MEDSTQKSPVKSTDADHSSGDNIASKKNQEEIKDQNNKNIFLTIIAGLFGLSTTVITAYTNIAVSKHTSDLNDLKKELQSKFDQLEKTNTHSQEFAREIETSLDNISGADRQAKAKMEMIRLYALTMSEPDSETAIKNKCVLLNIAEVSQNDALKQTITDLISQKDLANVENKDRCKAELVLSRKSLSQEEKTRAVDYISSKSDAELLKKVFQVSNEEKKGWLYVGKENDLSKELELDNTIDASSVFIPPKDNPTKMIKVKTIKDVILRESFPDISASGKWTLGKVITVIDSNTTIEVLDGPVKIPIDRMYHTDWIHVSVVPSSSSGK